MGRRKTQRKIQIMSNCLVPEMGGGFMNSSLSFFKIYIYVHIYILKEVD